MVERKNLSVCETGQVHVWGAKRIWKKSVNKYSKTCVKWPLKNRQNKDLNDKW